MVLLPAFGLVYAVGVARVLGPRVVLRRSLQYALANRTLTLLAVLPAIGLLVSLVSDRQKTIGELATSSPGLYVVLIAVSVAAFVYRDRARQWLDQRFFREEYDARKILLSLVSRVRFETDPTDLANMVVAQLDEALASGDDRDSGQRRGSRSADAGDRAAAKARAAADRGRARVHVAVV